jgi:NADPH2:quinone reductase
MVCKYAGAPDALALEELPSPPMGRDDIRVSVKACGVNFADSLTIAGLYQDMPPLPFIPGFELAGVISEVGANVQGFKVDDRVITLNRYGGYGEEVIASANAALTIPPAMDFITAAAFPVAYGTAYLALKLRGRLKAGEVLAVLGAGGGAGLAAVELGKLMGATVIACAGSDEKLAVARQHGADHLVNHTSEDLTQRLKELTQGRGVDVIYDPVGGKAFTACLKAIAFEGRVLLIGFASGDIPKIAANHLLVKNVDVIGIFWGAYKHQRVEQVKASLKEIMGWFERGLIQPHISQCFPLDKTADAINLLLSRRSTGKIVVKVQA